MTGAVHRARRVTMWSLGFSVLLGWLGAFSGIATAVTEDRFTLIPAIAAGLGLIVFTGAMLLLVRAVSVDWTGDPRAARRYSIISGAAALFIMIVQDASPTGWGLIAICWISLAAIRTGRVATVLISLGTVVTCSGLYWINPEHEGLPIEAAVFIYAVMGLTLPYANRLWIWILNLTETAHASKDAEARLAVTEERLRFARDLHDLVGHSLSVIAVKSELAGKLASRDADRAADEMAQVRSLAQDSLRQIREAVRGYRVLDLADEIASVRAILEADGIRCRIDMPSTVVDPAVTGPFAWVVRECATNILRHSTATWCTVTLRATGDSAVLEIVNDGAADPNQAGNGLAGLSERLTAIGGSLTARPTGDGRFLVRAVAPLSPTPAPASASADAPLETATTPEPEAVP